MAPYVTEVLLWLFVVNHGVALGGGLYEMRIVVPPWIDSVWKGQAARFPDAGPRFCAFVTTGPLTLLTLASLATVWQTPVPPGSWCLVDAVPTLVERVMTFAY